MILDNNHWKLEDFKQRMSIKAWEELLLNHEDKIIFKGCVRQLEAKRIFGSVVEVYKKEKKE